MKAETLLHKNYNTKDKNTYKVYIITPHAHLNMKQSKVQLYA